MYFANTHMHSTFSDGVYTPEKLVELGKEIGHKAMLLTDHDTVAGQHRFMKAARKADMLTMISTEISVVCSFGRFHLVCVDFDPANAEMRKLLENASACITELSHFLMDEGLKKGTLREGIGWQDVLDRYPGQDYLCNNQIFDLLVEKGIYKQEEYPEFFETNFHRDPSVKRSILHDLGYHYITAEEAIKTVLQADGVPIIAHPSERGKYFFKEETEKYLKLGVKGFETCHPIMSADEREFYNAVCDKHGLYKLGGSDHYGVLGGFCDRMPKYCADPSEGYTDEENFMKLYRRELG